VIGEDFPGFITQCLDKEYYIEYNGPTAERMRWIS